MFFFVAAAATAAVLGQVVKWDDQNQAVSESRRKTRSLARNIGRLNSAKPVTAKPEFVVREHPAWGAPLLFTGREAIWWQEEGHQNRDSTGVARKIRWIVLQQESRKGLVRAGRAGIQ